MRVWIDLDNSPHVLFFAPIIKYLEKRGIEVIVTARAFSQTTELALAHGLRFATVGTHRMPKSLLGRVSATLWRALQLTSFARRKRPAVAISHGSRALTLAAWLLGVPSMTLYDYEFVSAGVFKRLSSKVMVPEIVADRLINQGFDPAKVIGYPGFKEEVYVHGFVPDPSVLPGLGLNSSKLLITVRPPADWAHYHSQHSDILFRALVERLRREEEAQIVVLARTDAQRKALARDYGISTPPFIIPAQAIDALSLMWYSDAVFSGGGTMVREAALLGLNVFSTFAGKTGAADQALVAAGKLRIIQQPEEIAGLTFVKRSARLAPAAASACTQEFVFQHVLQFVCDKAHAPASALSAQANR